MTTNIQRREEIMKIVRETPVASQEELMNRLQKRGFSVTQPTLSRDIHELNLVKSGSGWTLAAPDSAPVPGPTSRLEQLIRQSVVSITQSGTIVVVRTPAAAAQPVARALDDASLDGVLGTLGGDDTIFVAAGSESAARAVTRTLSSMLQPARRKRP